MVVGYELNEPDVVAETIDNEAIVINLEKGVYFSIRSIGLYAWEALLSHHPSEVIASELSKRFPAEAAKIDEDMRVYLKALLDERLLRVTSSDRNHHGPFPSDNLLSIIYECPAFQKYTDMEALLLLDPIHDTDEQGWPHTK